jgi:hypothetical protein
MKNCILPLSLFNQTSVVSFSDKERADCPQGLSQFCLYKMQRTAVSLQISLQISGAIWTLLPEALVPGGGSCRLAQIPGMLPLEGRTVARKVYSSVFWSNCKNGHHKCIKFSQKLPVRRSNTTFPHGRLTFRGS